MIKLIDVNKVHQNNKHHSVHALKDVNLELPDKGFVLLVGANGSGKSTLLSILGGLDTVSSGQFLVNDQDFSNLKQHQLDDWRGNDIAYVFQEYNILSAFTVAENVALGRTLLGEKVTNREISETLEKVNLAGFEDRYLKDLSGGEKQKVTIARALIKQPKMILIDEPTAHADEQSAKSVLDVMREISKDTLVVAVSHNDLMIKEYADRVILINDGKIVDDFSVKREKKQKAKKSEPTLQPIKTDHKKLHTFKVAYQLGTKTYAKNWKRSLASILITAFSLLFFMVAAMLSGFSRFDTLALDALNNNDNYFAFSGNNINEQEESYLKSKLGGQSTMKHIALEYGAFSGIIEVPQTGNKTTVFGQEILYKDLAAHTDEGMFGNFEDKVMITDYLATKIINKAITIYDYSGNEYDNEIMLTNDVIVDGSVYLRFGKSSIPEDGDIFASVSGIVGTDWQKNQDFMKDESKYTVVYAAEGYTTRFMQALKISDIYISDLGAFMGNITHLYDKPSADPEEIKFIRFNDYPYPYIEHGNAVVSKNLWMSLGSPQENTVISFSLNGGELVQVTVIGYYPQTSEHDKYINIELNISEYQQQGYAHRQKAFKTTQLMFLTENFNTDKLSNIIETVESTSDLVFSTINAKNINNFSDKIELFKTTFLMFAIFSLMLSIAVLYDHISSLIMQKKRDIGIFRSMGARASTIFTTFITTVSIIAIITFLLATTLSIISTFIINAVAVQALAMPLKVATITFWHILSIFVTCGLVGLVATTVPVYNYANQSPVQQLKR